MLAIAALSAGCEDMGTDESMSAGDVHIVMNVAGSPPGTRSEDPDENLVSDMNILVFDSNGMLEEKVYLKTSQMEKSEAGYVYRTTLLRGCRYSVYACANMGYSLDLSTIEELEGYRYYLVYPDDYRMGMPMCGKAEDITVPYDGKVSVPLERLMAKVSLSIDRSALSEDVEFHVRRVLVGACPRSAALFKDSMAATVDDIFNIGFSKDYDDVALLNVDTGYGKSGSTDVYILENMHGDLLDASISDQDKVFDEGNPLAGLCSYIEIEADYISDSHYTEPGESLRYRFYLGEDNGNFDVRRNRHYDICVRPENDGISEDSWRVDRSGLGKYVTEIRLSYSTLEMTYFGETVVIHPYVLPEDASDSQLVWTSDDSSVAEVSPSGAVTARRDGTCSIRCEAADGSGTYAECKVTVSSAPYYMRIYPGNFIRGKVGDEIHLTCEYFPPSATFDIGADYLEYDRERGIYDYLMDEDGLGVRLSLKGRGSGMIYMETGYPVSQSELIVIAVD